MILESAFIRVAKLSVVVHPDWTLTDELVLVIAISAPWFYSYFKIQVGGG